MSKIIIIGAIILVALCIISQIDKELFYATATVTHVVLCWGISSILPKGILRTLAFIMFLGLVLFPINGIYGLATGIMGTILECKEAIPGLYKMMGQEMMMIPSAVRAKDISNLTPHVTLLGIAAIFMLGKLFLTKAWESAVILRDNTRERKP